MRLTIIVDDSTMYVDGESYANLNVSSAPEDVRALQWYGEFGEVEFRRSIVGGVFVHPANLSITELPSWVLAIKDGWDAAKVVAQYVAPPAETVDLTETTQ